MGKIRISILSILFLFFNITLFAQQNSFSFEIDNIVRPTNFLPSEPGTPALNSVSKYITVPKNAKIEISININKDIILDNILLNPSREIPSDLALNESIGSTDSNFYSTDSFFPQEIINYERIEYTDFDLILLNIATERYNAKEKKLQQIEKAVVTINTDANGKIRIEGNAFDEMLINIIENPEIFSIESCSEINGRRDGANYLIITPNNAEIKRWADTLKTFREQQGIITKVLTMKDIKHNSADSLKAFLKNVNDNWSPRPAAVLLLGDFSNDPALGIPSFQLYDHPQGSQFEPYLADNKLVDFNNNGLPSIVIARMPAATGAEAQLMVSKTIDYERNPYPNPNYYSSPTTSMGFQLSRWFQLCTEIMAGYFDSHNKTCNRINAIYEGPADSLWSTAQNTDKVIDYFGTNGLNYIPDDISHLTHWNNNGYNLKNALENGTFMLIHRDHGTFETWGEPLFSTEIINNLQNDMLSFIMSIDCQTGAFGYNDNGNDCLAERFLRIKKGAMAVIAASQLSYSFVNDTYAWGVFDYLFPDFLPDYGGSTFDFKYPAFANAYGKYYLKQSSFPYNDSYKTLTNNLLHYFGDAYLQLYTEMPQNINVTHQEELAAGSRSVTIFADNGSSIGLSIDNVLIAKGKTINGSATLHFNPVNDGSIIKVVVTKQNHYRHESYITVGNGNDNDDDDTEDIISIYPNPVDNILIIEGKNINNIFIYNSLGQIIIEKENASNEKTITIDCADLPLGLYHTVVSSDVKTIKRFIVVR
ncbi:MAG: C25 family cysteine peptidase [Candidatus Limimorpha sp.]